MYQLSTHVGEITFDQFRASKSSVEKFLGQLGILKDVSSEIRSAIISYATLSKKYKLPSGKEIRDGEILVMKEDANEAILSLDEFLWIFGDSFPKDYSLKLFEVSGSL